MSRRAEVAAYVVVAFLATALRLAVLGAAPLSTVEAANAWTAWMHATGRGGALPESWPFDTSALLMSAQFLLFVLGGSSEALARLPSALAGVALALLPILVRPWMGSRGAVALAVLMAIDPTFVSLSRQADGAVLSSLLASVVVVGLLRASRANSEPVAPRWLVVSAVCAGLLTVSGRLAWSYWPVIVLFVLMEARRPLERIGGHAVGPLVAAFVAAAFLGASGFLAAPELIGSVSSSLTAWLGAWSGNPDPARRLLGFLRTQPIVAALAVVGIVRWWTTGPRRTALPMTLTMAWGVVLLCASADGSLGVPVLELALIVAAAPAVVLLWEGARRIGPVPSWVAAGLAVVAVAAILLRETDVATGVQRTDPDVRRLADDVLSLASTSVPASVFVAGDAVDPVVAWALRATPEVRFSSGADREGQAGRRLLLITSEGTAAPPVGAPSPPPFPGQGARYRIRPASASSGPETVVLWVSHEP